MNSNVALNSKHPQINQNSDIFGFLEQNFQFQSRAFPARRTRGTNALCMLYNRQYSTDATFLTDTTTFHCERQASRLKHITGKYQLKASLHK